MAADSFDVVIAGAGMVGSTLALACAHAGLRSALIDPLAYDALVAPDFDGRASAIAFASLRQWQVLGAAQSMVAEASPIRSILVTDGRSAGAAGGPPAPLWLKFDSDEIAQRGEDEPLGWMIENRHIRAALAQAVLDAPIELIAPAAVAAVETGPGGASVRLADGRIVRAPLIVGADGRGSVVRKAAGVDVVGWTYPQTGVVATVAMAEPHGDVAHEYFLPGGPFAILPLTGNRASLVWTEPARRAAALMSAAPEAFETHLRRRFGEFLGEVRVEGSRFSYPLSLQLASKMIAPRVALVGDAAHAVHPIAGQGLNLGLKDAAALAEVLAHAARLGEDLGSVAVLERYARWRRFDNVMLAAATDLFNRLFSNNFPPLRAARGLGLAAVDAIGPARRFFMREAGGAVGDLPRLLRGEPL